jgi:hypothetical protein
MRFVLALIALTACGGGTASGPNATDLPKPDAQKAYAIHLSRASHVGERSHVVMDQTEQKDSKITGEDGAVIEDKHQKRVLHYDAVHTVVAVDDKGRTTRSRYDVKDLLADGKPLMHGVVEITRAPKEKDAVIVVDGKPATDELRDALSSLLKLGLGSADDDEVFGTKTPQAIGAHWPINGALAKASLSDDTGIDAQSVTGDVWLAGTTKVGDLDCLDVRGKLGIEGMTVPELPEGSVTESGRADAEMQTALPVADAKVERATDHMSMVMAFKVRIPTKKGPPATVALKLSQVRDSAFSPM